jgi:hypothetical protein
MPKPVAPAPKTPTCPHCQRPLRGAKVVHRRCARFHVVTTDGTYTQLSFLDPVGRVSRSFRWKTPPLGQLVADVAPVAVEAPKPLEAYAHTPGKCAKCGKRVRNKKRLMHRRCLNQVLDPPPPPKPKVIAVNYPPARFCPSCRSLDNGMYPATRCRACGAVMGDVPDHLRPLVKEPVKPKRTRIRGR